MHYTSRGIFLVAVVAALASPAVAQPEKDDAARDSLEAVAVVVDAKACLGLVEPADGRGVAPADGGAYVPGVDARGRPVVPADAQGGVDWSVLTETLTINVEVELAERYGLALPPGSTLPLGTIEVRDGRATFNGQPLGGHDREALWRACRQLGVLQNKAGRTKPAQP